MFGYAVRYTVAARKVVSAGELQDSECSVTQCVILLNPELSFRNAALRHESGILIAVDGLSSWAKAVGGEPRLP